MDLEKFVLSVEGDPVRAAVMLAMTRDLESEKELIAAFAARGVTTAATMLSGRDFETRAKVSRNLVGLCLNAQGNYSRAASVYAGLAALEEERYQKERTPLSQASYARALYNVAENAFKAGKYSEMRENFAKCISLYGDVADSLGSYHRSEYLARLAYFNIIVKRDYAAAEKAAREAFDEQPESLFVCYNLGYALLMNKSYEDCDKVFEALAATGAAAAENVRLDFEDMKKAGISDPHMDEVLALMTR